jgi:hypothetical protein
MIRNETSQTAQGVPLCERQEDKPRHWVGFYTSLRLPLVKQLRVAAIVLVATSFVALTFPTSAAAWSGFHTDLSCKVKLSLGGGTLICDAKEEFLVRSVHPGLRGNLGPASYGDNFLSFTLARDGLSLQGGRHVSQECTGVWSISNFGSQDTHDFGVRCTGGDHPDMACEGNGYTTGARIDFSVRCHPMEYKTSSKWLYWDLGHGYDASIVLDKLSGGRARVKIMDLPDVTTVKFIFYSLSTKKKTYKTVDIVGDRAVVTMPKKGRYYVSVVVGEVTSEKILVVR